jgi:hypothetical protein
VTALSLQPEQSALSLPRFVACASGIMARGKSKSWCEGKKLLGAAGFEQEVQRGRHPVLKERPKEVRNAPRLSLFAHYLLIERGVHENVIKGEKKHGVRGEVMLLKNAAAALSSIAASPAMAQGRAMLCLAFSLFAYAACLSFSFARSASLIHEAAMWSSIALLCGSVTTRDKRNRTKHSAATF